MTYWKKSSASTWKSSTFYAKLGVYQRWLLTDYTKILYFILGVKLGNPMYQNTFGKASIPLVSRAFLGFFLCNYAWSRALAGYNMFHFRERSWVSSCATMPGPEPWPVVCPTSVHRSATFLGIFLCNLTWFRALAGYIYVSLPSTYLSAVLTWGTFLRRPVLVTLPVHLFPQDFTTGPRDTWLVGSSHWDL